MYFPGFPLTAGNTRFQRAIELHLHSGGSLCLYLILFVRL
jgi:hypothetical protein